MKKKILFIFLGGFIMLGVTGCGEKYYCYDGDTLKGQICERVYDQTPGCPVGYSVSEEWCIHRSQGLSGKPTRIYPIYGCLSGDEITDDRKCIKRYDAFTEKPEEKLPEVTESEVINVTEDEYTDTIIDE
jgi:hypothetical protein